MIKYPDKESFKGIKLADVKAIPGVSLRYTGHRPFVLVAGDVPVMRGDVIDDGHVYAGIRDSLVLRADFEEIDHG